MHGTLKLRKKKTAKECAVEILPDPFIYVRKNGERIALRSTCLPFWDKLQLEPLSGKKNVKWISLGNFGELEPNLAVYLQNIGSLWRNSLFGTFEPFIIDKNNGMLNCVKNKEFLDAYREIIPTLG